MFFYIIIILVSLLMIAIGLHLTKRYPKLSDVLGIIGTIIFLMMVIGGITKITPLINSSNLN